MDLFFCRYFPDLNLGDGFIKLLLMLGFSLGVLLNGILVVENGYLLFDIPQLRDGLMDAQNEKIFDRLPLVTFLLYLLKIFIPVLNSLLLLHGLDELFSRGTVRRLL